MRARYYSEKRIREEAGNVEIIESAYPTERLMKNNYVHTGIYNFEKIAKPQEKALPTAELRKRMEDKFNEEIAKSISRENKIYALRGVDSPEELAESLSLSAFGEKVWDDLNLRNLIDELIDKAIKEGSTYDGKDNKQAISGEKFNSELQSLFNEKMSNLKKDYDKLYGPLFDGFKINNVIKVKEREDIYLETLKKTPLAYFSNLSNYQGAVGEFATLIDSIAMSSVNENKIVTELFKKGFNSPHIEVVAPQGKSDISINSIGLSVKNYRTEETGVYNLSLHSGKSLQETFIQDFSEITSQQNFDLQSILEENNYNWDILTYFSYMFVNLYAFSTSGGYSNIAARQEKGGQNITKKDKNIFSQYTFITDFLKYSTIYWIGEKLLDAYSKDGQNTDPVAFMVLNKKLIPVSKILTAVRDDLGTVSTNIYFTGSTSYNPNVMREQKYRVIRQLKKNEKGNWQGKRYPDPLLQIGSLVGNSIIKNVKFNLRMKIDYNAF